MTSNLLIKEDITGSIERESSKEDEIILWMEYRLGSSKAFEEIYRKYSPLLYNYGCHLSNESDLVKTCLQELFTELWYSREDVGPVVSIKSFLFSSFRKRVIEEALKKGRIEKGITLNHNEPELFFSHEAFTVKGQLSEEQRHHISRALNALSDHQLEAIFLKFYDHLSFDEIAMVMSIQTELVYDIISKAITELRKVDTNAVC